MDLLSRPAPRADLRLHYGPGPEQIGDLWIPEIPGLPHQLPPTAATRLPVVVFFHGGWWKSAYDLAYGGHLCAAFKAAGMACWSVEYRRVGETGGGWPATFQDAAAGLDHVAMLAETYPLDLTRVITVGHSAGGHLAFWVAGRHHIDRASELYLPQPRVALRGAIALAGAVDLRLTIDLAGDLGFAHDRQEVYNLMGGTPKQHPERYAAGNPGDLLPLGVPQHLIQGTADDQIPPELPERWSALARGRGDRVSVSLVPGAEHLDVADPESAAWPTVMAAMRQMLLPG